MPSIASASAVVLVLMACGGCREAQAQSMEGGARAVATGNAATALEGDAWGHANPATPATLSRRMAGFFGSQAYGLSELRLVAAQIVQPTRAGTFSLHARSFGFEAFRENHFSVGYARAVYSGASRPLHAGVRARLYHFRVAGYGSASTVGLSAGALVAVLPGVHFGFSATNFNAPKIHGVEEVPRTLSLGIGYRADETFLLLVDVLKDVRFPVTVRGGAEWLPVPALALRAGTSTAPSRLTCGAGVRLGHLTADVALERHDVLGWSPAISMSATW
jgi:hypothetical protein